MNFYNDIAHTYNEWVQNDSQAIDLTNFYREYLLHVDVQNIVYLGIATGRIALELVKDNSLNIVGIDNSQEMLNICENHFIDNKAEDKLTLLEQDILELHVEEKNNIYFLPFRTIAHFLTKEDKYDCLKSIYSNMQKGEVFIFDTDILNEEYAKETDGKVFVGYQDSKSSKVIYNKFNYDFQTQLVNIKVYTGKIVDGELQNIKQYDYNVSWISTEDMKKIILEIGFIIKDSIFENEHQIWVLEK